MNAIIVLTWIFIGLTAYVYVGYPAIIATWGFLFPKKVDRAHVEPTVCLIVAAFNEEAVIAEKIENSLNLDFPSDRLQIVVAADGSNDRTVEIAHGYSGKGVVVLAWPERRGKSAAINRAVRNISCDILVFSDANATYRPDAIRKLVRNFNDPSVGVVSGRKIVAGAAGGPTEAEGSYWKYESFIKEAESRSGSAAGVVGEINAIRLSVFETIPEHIINDDSFLALTAMRKGYRVIYEPEAVSRERPSLSVKDDTVRRRRMTAGRYQQMFAVELWGRVGASNVFRLVSHKFLRLLLPHFMLGALLLNSVAVIFPPRPVPLIVMLALQLVVYAMALLGFVSEKLGLKRNLFSTAYYFVNANIASGLGLVGYILRQENVLWGKARRL